MKVFFDVNIGDSCMLLWTFEDIDLESHVKLGRSVDEKTRIKLRKKIHARELVTSVEWIKQAESYLSSLSEIEPIHHKAFGNVLDTFIAFWYNGTDGTYYDETDYEFYRSVLQQIVSSRDYDKMLVLNHYRDFISDDQAKLLPVLRAFGTIGSPSPLHDESDFDFRMRAHIKAHESYDDYWSNVPAHVPYYSLYFDNKFEVDLLGSYIEHYEALLEYRTLQGYGTFNEDGFKDYLQKAKVLRVGVL